MCVCSWSKITGVLIEPVWDGNRCSTSRGPGSGQVLIEPVWDGNLIPVCLFYFLLECFNRTSVGWKHRGGRAAGQAIAARVLIEPVWDGNKRWYAFVVSQSRYRF